MKKSKVLTIPADEKGMSTAKGFIGRLVDLGGRLFAPPQEPLPESSTGWYAAGLCVDPHTFSDQLIKLQNSLRLEGQTVKKPEKRVRPVAH
jgi:hypothetical protein